MREQHETAPRSAHDGTEDDRMEAREPVMVATARRAGLVLVLALSSLAAIGCGGDALSADEAKQTAASLVGGEAAKAEEADFDGIAAWEVEVAMKNGAELEVLVGQQSGDLLEIEDKSGPFSYSLAPLSGHKTYAEAKQIAFDSASGKVEAWEIKRMEQQARRYRYEFYVRDADKQLWEVKFWANDGTPISKELKSAVD